jgi:hypothetical protein
MRKRPARVYGPVALLVAGAALAGCRSSVEGSVVASWDASSCRSASLRALAAAPRTNHVSAFLDPRSGVTLTMKFATAEEPKRHSPVAVHVDVVVAGNPGGWHAQQASVADPLYLEPLAGGRMDSASDVLLQLTRKAASQHLLSTSYDNVDLTLALHPNGFVQDESFDEGPATPEGAVLGTWDVGHSGACGVKALDTLPVTPHTTTYAEAESSPPSGLVLRLDYETAEEPTSQAPVIVSCTVTVEKNPNRLHADVREEGRDMKLYKVGSEYVLALTWDYNRTSAPPGFSSGGSGNDPLQLHADGTVKQGLPMGQRVE